MTGDCREVVGFLCSNFAGLPRIDPRQATLRRTSKSWPASHRFNKQITAILNMPVTSDEKGGSSLL